MAVSGDALAILDAAYAPAESEEAWLQGVAEATDAAIGRGCGLHAYLVDVSSPDRFAMRSPIAVGVTPEWAGRWRSNWWEVFMTPVDPAVMCALHRFAPCSYSTDVWDAGAAQIPTYAEYLAQLAATRYGETHRRYLRGDTPPGSQEMFYPDSLNLLAVDATGVGCALLVNQPAPREAPVGPAEAELWGRLLAHIAAGYRLLRQRLAAPEMAPPDAAELVLDERGRVQHAAGPATRDATRELLRDAMVRVDRARRTTERADAAELVEVWRALNGGRWSILDHFERDGRRYLLARPNAPKPAGPPRPLTEREAQVARHAALGHSNKLIAYELGLSPSTVATHLRSAMEKLGVTHRLELIRAVRARDGL